MSLELDHAFVLTEPGALHADQLVALGFKEGVSRAHPGQGTANRRFCFAGFTLELLYVSNAEEAREGAGKGLRIVERTEHLQASPFGIVVRVADATAMPAFSNWRYFPDYFNGKLCFHVGENSEQLEEPLCICMPPSLPRAERGSEENSQWQLTSLEISLPVSTLSSTLAHFEKIDGLVLRSGAEHHMLLTFNDAAQSEVNDLRPYLPLTIHW